MRLTQTRDLQDNWFIQIRYGKRKTFHIGRWSAVFPKTFYSETALYEWANVNLNGFKDRGVNND